MGDGSPISSGLSSLKKVILKALTENQILLLHEINSNSTKTVTTLVNELSSKLKIPISTLKLNSRILKKLDLIEFEISQPVELTDTGKLILTILER